METIENYPLVSVCVITYNSSKTILETLQSIRMQTYPNIELVISDDASKDDTVDLCKKWAKDNSDRFLRVSIITVDNNTGVGANANRAICDTNGEWVKIIAGDDLLVEDCLEIYIRFVKYHPDSEVLFSRVKKFKVKNGNKINLGITPSFEDEEKINGFNQLTSEQKFVEMLNNGIFLQPTSIFLKKDVLGKHKYPEEYRYEEDHPMILRLAKKGINMYSIPEVTVLYRISTTSLSKRKGTDFYSRRHMYSQSLFFWNESRGYYFEANARKGYENNKKMLLRYELVEAFTQNKVSFMNKIIRRIILFLVNNFAKFEMSED